MLTTTQLPQYFSDLRDARCASAVAIVHSRFSTNTNPPLGSAAHAVDAYLMSASDLPSPVRPGALPLTAV